MKRSIILLFLIVIIIVIILGVISLVLAEKNYFSSIVNSDNDGDNYDSSVDCNDSNSEVWQNVLVYIDGDHDGVGSGGLINLCIGNMIPLGYVSSSSPHNDCNDSNSNIWRYVFLYTDLDNDGFGTGNQTQMCIGANIPNFFSLNKEDCNDLDALINPNAIDIPNDGIDQNCDGFDNIDVDNDGFFRYSLNSSLKDCNDLNSNIYPGANEKCNNIDDDCDGKIDEDFSDKNDICYIGIGECRSEGKMICNSAGNSTFCRAVAKKPEIEICDGLDNDCDGNIDEEDICNQIYENMIILSPNQTIYDTKNIIIDITTGQKKAEIINMIDNSANKPKEVKLCSDCNRYTKRIQFSEGNHNLTFISIFKDKMYIKTINFFIDSKKPSVSSPKIITKGFTNGSNLSIKYSEYNLEKITLYYTIDHITRHVDKYDCPSGKNQICSFDLNLSEYNNKEIEYNFKITDVAGNYIYSKNINALIDVIPPVIENLESLYSVYGNRVYFKIKVKEDNFKDVSYFDPLEKNPSWRVLCTKLLAGICEKMQVFKPGEHNLSLKVSDKAGNYVQVEI
ncbi:MAG: putative metal-binding motif-containing protein [Candidatus Pacearchaeota archaeon]